MMVQSSRYRCLYSLLLARHFLYVPEAVGAFAPAISRTTSSSSWRQRWWVHHNAAYSNDKEGDASTTTYQVSIAYCTGCRWCLRSFWMAQEILTTFHGDPNLQAITIVPSSTSGQFTIQCHTADADVVLWDRKEQGGFPEMKQVKQLLRDEVEPSRFLGHSDTESRKAKDHITTEDSLPFDIPSSSASSKLFTLPSLNNAASPNLAIAYCTGCKWLFRAAWFAQELLQTFPEELGSLSLLPTRPPLFAGGTFQIYLNDNKLWDRAEQGKFPDIKEMKQLLRDSLNPDRHLGHIDDPKTPFESMDDDDAEEARRMFGVW